jgi:hypothetical protein
VLTVTADGRVGVDQTDPQNALVVAGTGQSSSLRNGVHIGEDQSGQSRLELVTNGGTPYIDFNNANIGDFVGRIILKGGDTLELDAPNVKVNGQLVQTSDGRLKTDVQPVRNALGTVMGLQGVTFDWKQGANGPRYPEGRQVGFVAQAVEKVLPEVVATDAGGQKAVAYQNIVPVLVEAVKDQQKEIAERDARIAEQNRRIGELERRSRQMDARLRALEAPARVRR